MACKFRFRKYVLNQSHTMDFVVLLTQLLYLGIATKAILRLWWALKIA